MRIEKLKSVTVLENKPTNQSTRQRQKQKKYFDERVTERPSGVKGLVSLSLRNESTCPKTLHEKSYMSTLRKKVQGNEVIVETVPFEKKESNLKVNIG